MVLTNDLDGPPVLPLWVNGHALLTLTSGFVETRDAISGKALRRVPLCGAEEVAGAVAAATDAAPLWAAQSPAARQAFLDAWAAELARYAAHFAALIVQETGKEEAAAEAEVAAAVADLQRAAFGNAGKPGQPLAIVWDATQPLQAATALLAPALLAGHTLILKPAPQTSGVAYALVELSARAELPAGVVNLVQGGEETGKILQVQLQG